MLNTLGSKTNARAQTLSAPSFVTKREPCFDPKENRSIADRMDEKSQERESFFKNLFLNVYKNVIMYDMYCFIWLYNRIAFNFLEFIRKWNLSFFG